VAEEQIIMATCFRPVGKSSGLVSGDPPGSLEPAELPASTMFSPLGCCWPSDDDASSRQHRYQERKLRMLTFWRDGLERQLAAVNAAMATLERQMERDRPAAP
jgi:hypothetical protein